MSRKFEYGGFQITSFTKTSDLTRLLYHVWFEKSHTHIPAQGLSWLIRIWVICPWNQFEEKAQWIFNLLFSCNLHSTFLPKCGHPNTHLWCLQCNVLNILEVNTVFFYVDVIRQSFFPARNRLIIGFKLIQIGSNKIKVDLMRLIGPNWIKLNQIE